MIFSDSYWLLPPVRRLLAKYGYPPTLSEATTQLVLKQAELSTDDATE